MRVLLDTHVLLWVFAGAKRIEPIRDVIIADDNDVFISTASWWELAIKIGLGKLDSALGVLRQAARDSGFIELPVTGEHAEALMSLPPLHKDPFDRLLLTQAIVEPMKLITADEQLGQYSELVWKIQ